MKSIDYWTQELNRILEKGCVLSDQNITPQSILLKSEYHLLERQAQGAICTVANNLLGRKNFGKWKQFEKGTKSDNNTLPAPTNSNRTEPYFEALVLAGIANEIMSSERSVVIYLKDGSSQHCSIILYWRKIKSLANTYLQNYEQLYWKSLNLWLLKYLQQQLVGSIVKGFSWKDRLCDDR